MNGIRVEHLDGRIFRQFLKKEARAKYPERWHALQRFPERVRVCRGSRR